MGKRGPDGKEDRGAITCTLKYNSTSRAAWVRFLITLAEGEFLVEELMTLYRKNRVRGTRVTSEPMEVIINIFTVTKLTQECEHDEIQRTAMTFYTSRVCKKDVKINFHLSSLICEKSSRLSPAPYGCNEVLVNLFHCVIENIGGKHALFSILGPSSKNSCLSDKLLAHTSFYSVLTQE